MQNKALLWLLRIAAALILLQTLYFKFTAHPESVALFTKLGMEPWGRIGTGIAEAITAILLLWPRTTWMGATLGAGLMSGALFFHLTSLGIYFGGDALLFVYAVVCFLCCIVLLFLHKKELLVLLSSKK